MKDYKHIHSQLPSKVHYALKRYTIDNDTSMANVLTELLTKFLQDNGYLNTDSHNPKKNPESKLNFDDISF